MKKRTESIDLPYPPTVNKAYRAWKGRIIKSLEARNYEKKVHDHLMMNRIDTFKSDRLRITIRVFMPDNRKRDLANLDKILIDSLESGGLFEDDEQIDDIRFIRVGVCKPGRVKGTIENLPEKKND